MRLWLRRRRHGSYACGVPTCPNRKRRNAFGWHLAWCDDHCDSIIAEAVFPTDELTPLDEYNQRRRDAAERLGPARWALAAEVQAVIERQHVSFYDAILAFDPMKRDVYEYRVWSSESNGALGKVNEPRVRELLALGLGNQ